MAASAGAGEAAVGTGTVTGGGAGDLRSPAAAAAAAAAVSECRAVDSSEGAGPPALGTSAAAAADTADEGEAGWSGEVTGAGGAAACAPPTACAKAQCTGQTAVLRVECAVGPGRPRPHELLLPGRSIAIGHTGGGHRHPAFRCQEHQQRTHLRTPGTGDHTLIGQRCQGLLRVERRPDRDHGPAHDRADGGESDEHDFVRLEQRTRSATSVSGCRPNTRIWTGLGAAAAPGIGMDERSALW
jgi:hypothetical protein